MALGPCGACASITIPLLKRSLVFAIAICLINGLGVFDAVNVLTRGGPSDSTNVVTFHAMRTAFDFGAAGRAAAMTMVLLVGVIDRRRRTAAVQPRHGRRAVTRATEPGARARSIRRRRAAAGRGRAPGCRVLRGSADLLAGHRRVQALGGDRQAAAGLVPGPAHLDAFGEAARLLPLGSAFFNSFLIAGVSTAAVVATSVAAGWAFADLPFKGRDQLFLLLVATMFVPPIATLVPLYWLVQTAGLQDTLVGVLLPQLANAFGIFLIRQFARGVPTELLDAARVDGASEWRILLQIGVPLLRPAIATLAMFAFVFYWNATCGRSSSSSRPATPRWCCVVNQLLSYTTAVKYANVVFAGTLLAIIPNLVLFMLVRRAYQDAGFSSAVKG